VSAAQTEKRDAAVDDLYAEAEHWHLNTGEETIHAKRMPGKWRTIKWLSSSFWLIFFLGPYLRWGERQAVLFDIPNRQFHIFEFTILPQDFWMLSLTLLFFAILLAMVTALAGRVWCGFLCFQTVWTDVYTWLEEKLEGSPQKRRKLDAAPMSLDKLSRRVTKHGLWLLIAALTGISFVAWFTDAYRLWAGLFSLEVSSVVWIVIALFTAGTYVLAGFLREQACFWLCPYARIQSVMVDQTTLIPTYDFHRGEPRGRARKGMTQEEQGLGDCVDCKQCIAVCPTGVDIRFGSQEGCIMCGLCIDACNTVMDKLDRPRGLIRYESLDALSGKDQRSLLKRPRIYIYSAILLVALSGITYGLFGLAPMELKVLHERQPLFVQLSDGSIQNKYTLKVLNKTNEDLQVQITVSGPEGLEIVGAERPLDATRGTVSPRIVMVKVPRAQLDSDAMPVRFRVEAESSERGIISAQRESTFFSR
jgi:cytochrome c oxidase accessory protein FixG